MCKMCAISPEEMTVITNIQGMRAIYQKNYDPIQDFQSLSLYDLETLRELQNKVIQHYNRYLKFGKNDKNN